MKRIIIALGLIVCVVIFSHSMAVAKRFASPPASTEWKVFCNKNGQNVVLGTQHPGNNYVQMAGPFYNEPSARGWVNKNCSSWKCDWNGRCVRASNNRNKPCPPGTHRDLGVFGQGSGRCIPNR